MPFATAWQSMYSINAPIEPLFKIVFFQRAFGARETPDSRQLVAILINPPAINLAEQSQSLEVRA